MPREEELNEWANVFALKVLLPERLITEAVELGVTENYETCQATETDEEGYPTGTIGIIEYAVGKQMNNSDYWDVRVYESRYIENHCLMYPTLVEQFEVYFSNKKE